MVKIVFYAVLIIAFFFGCTMVFNHFNPFVGILLAIFGGAFLVDRAIKIGKSKLNQ